MRHMAVVREHILILLGYALLALILTYPLLFTPLDTIVGNRIGQKDGWQTVWDIWWWRQGLVYQPGRPLFSHYIYWPTGVDLFAYRAYGLTSMLLGTPVLFWAGPVAAYKFNLLLNFTLSGYAMYLLARHYCGARWPAIAAGVVFTASPFHLARFGDGYHDLTAIQWLPLYLLALALWLERGRWLHGALALLLLAVVLLTSSYYTQFTLVWTAAAGVVWALYAYQGTGYRVQGTDKKAYRLAASGYLLPIARAGLLLVAWGLVCWPIIRRLSGAAINYSDYLLRQRLHSFDLLDFVLPSAIHPLWAPLDLHRIAHPYGSWNVVPGVALLIAGSLGLYLARRRVWPWALLGLLMVLFALGPTLHVADRDLGLPGPHALLNLFAAGRASQRPNHFLVLTSVVLALGLALLLARLRPRTALLVALAVVLVDCLPPLPWPRLPAPPPSWEATLAELPPGALIELPYRPREIDYQVTQLRHGRPIIGGYVSRVPPYPLNNHAVLARLTGEDVVTIADTDIPAQTRDFAAALCANTLVLHPELTLLDAATLKARVATQLPVARLTYDGKALVYRLPEPGAGQPLLVFGKGWYGVEQEGDQRWQWSEPRAELQLINPRAAPMLVQLNLSAYAAEGVQPARFLLDGQPLLEASFTPAPMRQSLQLRLPPQAHVELVVESQGPRRRRNLGLAFAELRLQALPGQNLPCPAAQPLDPGLR